MSKYSIIVGTGSYIPTKCVTNQDFLKSKFFDRDGKRIEKNNNQIVEKLQEITEIRERRHISDDLLLSDIASYSAKDALTSSGIDGESLDYIIVAHNFGNVKVDNRRSDCVPSIAARVKHSLKIKNPDCVAYDLLFGCPGWLQGVIQADYYLKSGDAKRVLVIGSETLSRVSDPHDIDSMIYADGAGATILESVESDIPVGIISHKTRTDSLDHAYMLRMDKSYDPDYIGDDIFLKMDGHTLYRYALNFVPLVIKSVLEKAGLILEDIKKVLIHQANEKMDEAIIKRLFSLYNIKEVTSGIMPMIISWLGNSSVATIPTLLDLILKNKLDDHEINRNDNLLLASVGAGMNINSLIYRVP